MEYKPGENSASLPLLEINHPPRRVVSLVPSITESLFDLGVGHTLVGVTEFCSRPTDAQKITRVGGVRTPEVDTIQALEPELVIANREENAREVILALQARQIPVWVTFPTSVVETVEMLWALAGLFESEEANQKVRMIQMAFDWQLAAAESYPQVRYFCPIWQEKGKDGVLWWMTFNDRTYMADLLCLFGGGNCFNVRERHYPLEADLGNAAAEEPGFRDTRYPRVSLAEIRQADPELILLPDEPYGFTAKEGKQLMDLLVGTPNAAIRRIRWVDGSLLTWYGTRLASALSELPAFFTQV